MHKTSAWPLSVVYAGLIVYASLYPFTDWRDQGIWPWTFMTAPLPKYWTGFDVAVNVVGYVPLGFLLALTALRTGRASFAVGLATLAATVLSLGMESLQVYLPVRVPSNVDLGLNGLGASMGAVVAWSLEKLGVIDHWSRFRSRWFVVDARGALVLLALWPLALLFPAAVPFGLGQVMERLEAALVDVLADTPFLEWLPVRDIELQPLVPGMELVCVALGLLIPCLLGFFVIPSVGRRVLFALMLFAAGLGVTALSAALSFGPEHAWAWFSLPVRLGLIGAGALACAALGLSRRTVLALLLLALGIYLSLLNQSPASPYFEQTLSDWEQGRFIRFHGLAQWLGWLWPYAALVYLLIQVGEGAPKKLESSA
ncbi:MAG: VanZ family protein [Rhodoferax sp.]|nr:VanZ family protein [Rhodoferax sp.]